MTEADRYEKAESGDMRILDSKHAHEALRDHFAAQALPNIMREPLPTKPGAVPGTVMINGVPTHYAEWARKAYQVADAMLAERQRS